MAYAPPPASVTATLADQGRIAFSSEYVRLSLTWHEQQLEKKRTAVFMCLGGSMR